MLNLQSLSGYKIIHMFKQPKEEKYHLIVEILCLTIKMMAKSTA